MCFHTRRPALPPPAGQVCLLCTRVALCNPAGVKHFTLTKVVDDSATASAAQVGRVEG